MLIIDVRGMALSRYQKRQQLCLRDCTPCTALRTVQSCRDTLNNADVLKKCFRCTFERMGLETLTYFPQC